MRSSTRSIALCAALLLSACGGGDAPQGDGAEPPPATARLTVTALRDDGETPFAGARVSLRPLDGSDSHYWVHSELSRGTPDQVLLVDAFGEVEFTTATGVAYELRVEPYDTGFVAHSEEVAPLAEDEARRVEARVLPREVLVFHARVVDAESGAPLFGARIDRGGFDEELQAPPLTDRDGRFEVGYFESEVGHGFGLPFSVTMRDRTPLLLRPERGHATPGTARELRMELAASLRLTARDATGAPIPHALVRLETDRGPQDRTQGEFGASPLPPPPQDRQAGDGGVIAFYEQPAGCPLWVMVKAGEREYRHPVPFVLQPGETREVDLRVDGHAAVTGVLTDEGGAPGAGTEMWLVAGDVLDYPFPGPSLRRYRVTDTDDDGAFTFQDVPPGSYLVAPAPRSTSTLAAGSVPVVVPRTGAPAPVTVVAARDRWIEGRLVGPDGAGVDGGRVFAEATDGRFGGVGEVGPDGAFRVGPLIAGEYRLQVVDVPLAGHVAPEAAPVTVADESVTGVELELVPGAALRVRVARSVRAPTLVRAYLATRGPGEAEASEGPAFAVPLVDGLLEVPGLVPGRYDVALSSMDGSFAWLRDVELAAGADPQPHDVELAPAGWVTVVHRGESRWLDARLAVDGRPFAWGTVDRFGRATLVAPPGVVELRLSDRRGREDVRAVTVVAGVELEVEF
jgi:hypothetical protein